MTLENLVRIKQLHREPVSQQEFENLLLAGSERLHDAMNTELSYSSRFDLAYSAAHSLSLAALRMAGYRSDKRYLVFHCLAYTSTLDAAGISILSLCHERRNLAEYEGHFARDEKLLLELIEVSSRLKEELQQVSKL